MLKDKVALITGGGRGIGRAIALAFAGEGMRIAVAARTRDQVNQVAGEIENKSNAKALALVCDVSDRSSVEKMFADTEAAFDHEVDILVNNAGVAEGATLVNTTDELWERHLAINLTGTFYCTRAALPAMLKRGYDQKLACGSLLAGGTLGILIPPSVMAIVYAVVAQQSLGELLVGSIFPGFLLSGLYISYILIRCYINPSLGPALPLEERVSTREKFALLRKTIAPLLLIVLVLGVIFVGIATPVEAAGIGTFGALFVSALHRRLNWPAVQEAAIATLKATAMVMWIFFGATMFVGFFIVKGGQTFVANTILGTGLPPYGILMLMMLILFVLGMFIDWVGILLLTVPIFLPIMKSLEWGGLFGLPGVRPEDVPLWYGVIFMVNMQMAFLSPPFGYSLFYLKSVAPPEITMATIFRAALQFMALQWLGVGLCIAFPSIVVWLPSVLYAR